MLLFSQKRILHMLLIAVVYLWNLETLLANFSTEELLPFTNSSLIGHSKVYQLYSSSSRGHLRITRSRTVDAKAKKGDEYARLVIKYKKVEVSGSKITIQSEKTGFYLCINYKGRVLAKKNFRDSLTSYSCVFEEIEDESGFSKYRLADNRERYVGFSKDGIPISAARAKTNSKKLKLVRTPLDEEEKKNNKEQLFPDELLKELGMGYYPPVSSR